MITRTTWTSLKVCVEFFSASVVSPVGGMTSEIPEPGELHLPLDTACFICLPVTIADGATIKFSSEFGLLIAWPVTAGYS